MPDTPPTTVYQEDEADVFVYATDWKEALDDRQVGGGMALSRDAQDGVRVGFILASKKRSCARYFLGFSYTGETDPDVEGSQYTLHREPPARDPEWPQVRAHSVAFQDLVPLAIDQNLPPDEEDEDPPEPVLMAKAESPFIGADGEAMYYAKYAWCMVTVRFKSFGRVRFLPDNAISGYHQEWRRFTEFTGVPAVQALTAEGCNYLKFAEGDTGLNKPNGKQYPAPLAELMAKTNFTVTWHDVPHEYLTDSLYFLYPTKIVERLGCVNDEDMFDGTFLKGTMLLLGAEFDSTLFPVAPQGATEVGDNAILTGWRVKLHFEHFDPQNKGVPESEYRGHRLYPWRIDGKWYYAKRPDSENELLPLVNMMRVFQHVSDPG